MTHPPASAGSGCARPRFFARVAWKWFAFDSLGSAGVPSAPGLLLSQQTSPQLLLSCLLPAPLCFLVWEVVGPCCCRGASFGAVRAMRAQLKLLGPIAIRVFHGLPFSSGLTLLPCSPWHMAQSCRYHEKVSSCLSGKGNLISN